MGRTSCTCNSYMNPALEYLVNLAGEFGGFTLLVHGTFQTETCSQIAGKVCGSTAVLEGVCHDLLVMEAPCTRGDGLGREAALSPRGESLKRQENEQFFHHALQM